METRLQHVESAVNFCITNFCFNYQVFLIETKIAQEKRMLLACDNGCLMFRMKMFQLG